MLRNYNAKKVLICFFLSISVFFTAPSLCAAADVVRVGTLSVVDTLPLIVGQEEGLFADKNIDLRITPFQSAIERDAAFQAGKLDGYFGDLLNTLLLIGSGQDIGIVTTAFHTTSNDRMFGIAVAPESGINDINGLNGKKVAISRATIIEFLLDDMLESQNLKTDFVIKEEIKKMPIRLQMLLSNQVDAAVLPEPLLTLAESKGARVVFDDRRLDTTLTVIALSRNVFAGNDNLRTRFLSAYGEAVKRINENPEAYKDVLVNKTRFPKQLKDNYSIPAFPPADLPSEKDINKAQDWLERGGMSKERLSYDKIVIK